MPTTCGYPNCKFRSRYRGQEDNRHFYRIPKRPAVLRQAWLNAIGRSEETVVSQLRICSAHFFGGEKHEGDIPVADPQIDTPEFIELPPKESRTAERKSRLKVLSSAPPPPSSSTNISSPSIDSQRSSSTSNPLIIRHSRRGHRTNFGLPFSNQRLARSSFNSFNQQQISNQIFGNLNSVPGDNENNKNIINSISSKNPFIPQINNVVDSFPNRLMIFNSIFANNLNNQHLHPPQFPPISLSPNKNEQTNILTNNITNQLPKVVNNIQKPLVALLDGRDCSVEMPLLKDIATVAFCDAQSISDVHEKVLNEANIALLYQSIILGREELKKFKSLKAVIRIGPGYNNIDINAATDLGIAICHTPIECLEENADSAISLILNLFRKTFSLSNFIQKEKKTLNIEQIIELMNGSKRIRGSTLGIIGMESVGIAVALRAKVFGFRVIFYDNNLELGMENALGMERCFNLTELLSQSDCLTLHCPLTSENKHLINLETIKYLKFGVYIVNTSEFDLIESNALISALKNGNILNFAMDCDQPKDINERENYEILCSMPNVICTPKIGWYCQESHNELRVAAAKEVRRALTGSIPEDLKNCVNKSEILTLKGFLKIRHESSKTSLFSKDSVNTVSPIFPQFPLLNVQTTSLKNPFVNSIPNNFSNDLFKKQQLNNIQTKLSNPLNNLPPNFLLMNPNLLQTIVQMKRIQTTKIEENFAETSTTFRTENEEREEIIEESLVNEETFDDFKEINSENKEIIKNNKINKNEELEETEMEEEKKEYIERT